jgi:hypothetical protein
MPPGSPGKRDKRGIIAVGLPKRSRVISAARNYQPIKRLLPP